MHWLSIIGKILLMVAGLVALLDVVGPTRLKNWAGRSDKRRTETSVRRQQLSIARGLRKQANVTRAPTAGGKDGLDSGHTQYRNAESDAQRYMHGRLVSRRRWTVPLSAVALGSVVWLALAIALFRWWSDPHANQVLAVVGSFAVLGTVALAMAAALLSPTIQAWLMWMEATAWFRLAEASVKAVGNEEDGRPVRAIALVVFILGSLADLIGSWQAG